MFCDPSATCRRRLRKMRRARHQSDCRAVPRGSYCEQGVEEGGDNLNEVGLCVRTMTRPIVQAAVETIVKRKDEEEEVLPERTHETNGTMAQRPASKTAEPAEPRKRRRDSSDDEARNMPTKRAVRNQFEERETTLEKAEQYRILTAKMPVGALAADWSEGRNRMVEEKHVKALCKIFTQGGLNRADHHVAVLATRSEVECMLRDMGLHDEATDADDMPAFDDWLSVNRQVELMDGQHRIKALERYVSETGADKKELWWPCDFYDRDTLPPELNHKLRMNRRDTMMANSQSPRLERYHSARMYHWPRYTMRPSARGTHFPAPTTSLLRCSKQPGISSASMSVAYTRECLRLGHHPQPFREAEVVMIAKPGRRNLSTPRAWRPISLLSCLGKGLERLIARRLAWASIHYGVLHPQQAGALPKRSAVDLVAALVHDIEEAFARGLVATLVTMHIQGAFDTVLRNRLINRLILRLRQQGWPEHLARWAGSFMSDRSACVRYQDITTPSSPLQCGLPQGSPVSPILFLLYTEPICRLGNPNNPKGRFGYADDTGILCVGNSLETTADMASRYVSELVTWGAANGISFDPAKTEVMHFCRTKPKVSPPIFHEGERRPEKAMRWLGIWLDSTLTFKSHVEKWTASAQAVAHHLRGLANTKHGPLPSAMQRAVRACVEPVLLHGVEAWYPGLRSPRWRQPRKEGSSGIQQLLRKMNKSLHNSMRAVLPVWRTTPIAALHRGSGIPPIAQLLETRRMRFAARLKRVDEAHPLATRTLQPKPPTIHRSIKLKYQMPREAFRTRFRRSDQLLPRSTRPLLLPHRFNEHATPLQTASKDESAEDFRVWLRSIPRETLIVYSDGSLSTEKTAGYGYVIHRNGLTLTTGNGRLGPAEVFDAEAKGALEGLRAALNLPNQRRIFVCLDNLGVATCLRGMPADSSQEVFLDFQALATTHGATEVRWIPGHTNIAGNEEADALAKAATSLPEPPDALPTLAHLRRTARQQSRDAFAA
ncbi:hypothetical protein PCL_10521 [Purpureocillium lilacinum]|uniref:Reverse transcriptase n=1 Tax=Purpureocillium lilacinum TaxID=33203 RepID=A0A2U3DQ47_PURLI|nr:hypothetical protein PCL_10521 [Purpureocillium lilacinum]